MPTIMFWPDGLRIDPEVSVPTPTVARLSPTAMPGPELDPPVCRTGRPSLNGAVVRGSLRGSYELNPYPTFGRAPPSWKRWQRRCELSPVVVHEGQKLAAGGRVPLPRV